MIVSTSEFSEKLLELCHKGEGIETPKCAKCGEQLESQTPFFRHVLYTHSAKFHVERKFMITTAYTKTKSPEHPDN